MNRVSGNKLKQTYFDPTPDADHQGSGIVIEATVGENVTIGQCLYLKSDGKYWKTDADASATTLGKLAAALGTIAADATGALLESGYVRDDTWNWTIGGVVYVSTTVGEFTQTAPSGAGDVVRIVGYAVTADVIYFDPAAFTVPLPVNMGGTGAETLTDHGVLVGSGIGAITPLGVATNGQLIIGSTGADPVVASLTAGSGITLTPGAGSLSIATSVSVSSEQLIKAWINFNGTGTIAISDSYNVTSITDNGTGDYTITWDVDFAGVNYSVTGLTDDYQIAFYPVATSYPLTVGACRIQTYYVSGITGQKTYLDRALVCVMAIGDQ